MSQVLILSIRFHDGRYHGSGGWPPSPARLFQALIAASARGVKINDKDSTALRWLECLNAPVIAAPVVRRGQRVTTFVLNNDLDVIRDLSRFDHEKGKHRVSKEVCPWFFDEEMPILYVWNFASGIANTNQAQTVCSIAEHLYQLGRSIDMSWCRGTILSEKEIEPYLLQHGGIIYRPAINSVGTGIRLSCPKTGSFNSLRTRFESNRVRFRVQDGETHFAQPPKPDFVETTYNSPSTQVLFDLRAPNASFLSWPSTRTNELVMSLRDQAQEKSKPFKTLSALADNARLVPLPSIGHKQADQAIRRVLVDVSPNSHLDTDDIVWLFSGLRLSNPATGELLGELVRSTELSMLKHYCIGEGDRELHCTTWRTITPAMLKVPLISHRAAGATRMAHETAVVRAAMDAIRNLNVPAPVEAIRVQREPFDVKGAHTRRFTLPIPFGQHSLFHVEVVFAKSVRGPLVIGKGSNFGLGLMAPCQDVWRETFVFSVSQNIGLGFDRQALLKAVQRVWSGVLQWDQTSSGEADPLFLALDIAEREGSAARLIIAAPWMRHGQDTNYPQNKGRLFDRTVSALQQVRVGRSGVVTLGTPQTLAPSDPLLGPAKVWDSRTPFRMPFRMRDEAKSDLFIRRHILAECRKQGLPKPEVTVLNRKATPANANWKVWLRLSFGISILGPLMLGHDGHSGSSLFASVHTSQGTDQGMREC